jgi:hypothetical protein
VETTNTPPGREQAFMSNDPTMYSPAEIKAMAERALKYLMSTEGQMRLRERDLQAEAVAELFRKSRYIPWEKLHEPFTV